MRAATESSPEWVIKETTFFDHQTHRFVVGDIEIDGERIAAITPPGASARARSLDARRYVCTPGLVSANTALRNIEAPFDRLLQAGITTAGRICATAAECIAATSHTRVRPFMYLLINGFSRARAGQSRADGNVYWPEQHAFEQMAALVAGNGGRLLPAIHCPSVLSAQELVYAGLFAQSLYLDLGLVLSDCAPAAQAFRERFYCSETHLLAFLQLLRPGIAVWGSSQLTRHDVGILRASGVDVFGMHARSPRRRGRGPYAEASADATADGRACGKTPLDLLAGPVLAAQADADALVDAATVRAAKALGDQTCGRIARGMRADLCLFAMPEEPVCGLGSEAFLRLFESRPHAVLVGGKVAYGAIERSRDDATVAPRPRDTLPHSFAPRLAASS